MTDTSVIHVRRYHPDHVALAYRGYDGIFDVLITGPTTAECSCGSGGDCTHVARCRDWLVSA